MSISFGHTGFVSLAETMMIYANVKTPRSVGRLSRSCGSTEYHVPVYIHPRCHKVRIHYSEPSYSKCDRKCERGPHFKGLEEKSSTLILS